MPKKKTSIVKPKYEKQKQYYHMLLQAAIPALEQEYIFLKKLSNDHDELNKLRQDIDEFKFLLNE
jgi:hypothetical protein